MTRYAAELVPAYAAARAICRRHAKSFYFASHFLPADKRDAAYAVYAFCRLLDDAVDETTDPAEMERELTRFSSLLDQAYANDFAATPRSEGDFALRAFADTVRRCGVPKKHFEELAVGCRMDLSIHRYANWADLEIYCYHVAGVVGLIMCYVFGLEYPEARRQAVTMGNAMQLTNILRDVAEDLQRGRIYLPADEMADFGVTETDLAAGTSTAGLRGLIAFEISRARALYRAGAAGLCRLENDGSRLTASVMATIYGGILAALERQRCDIFAGRVSLTLGQKLFRLPTALRVARREAGDALPTDFV